MTPPSRLAKIASNLFAGSILNRSKTHDHDGPPHPGYNLRPGPMRAIVMLTATGLGTGFAPVASGTFGTLPGIALAALFHPRESGWWRYIAATILISFLAVLASSAAEGIFRKKDDGRIVIDEVAGVMVTLLFAPLTGQAYLLGFLLFRFFDIVKLPPAFAMQNLRGGRGVVLDDIVSGVYACLVLHLLLWIF